MSRPLIRANVSAGCSWVEHLTRLSCEFLVSSTTFGFGTGLGSWVRACTLLGPEGPGVTLFGLQLYLWAFFCCLCSGGWYRPYFENYTVDASILEMNLRIHFTGDLF